MKKWTVVNTGKSAWPVGTVFKIVKGENFKYIQTYLVELKKEVLPSETYVWEVKMNAPQKEG